MAGQGFFLHGRRGELLNKNELEQRLVNSNVPKDQYCLTGGLPNEAYCLNNEGDEWEVYYSERGVKSQLKTFESEDDACDYFYRLLLEMQH
jgi:hypothetical protein